VNTAKTARTRSVGTKLTEAEYAQVETAAARRGLTVGEWSREELLRAAGVPTPAATAAEQMVMAEVLALRTILLNLFYDLARAGEIQADRMEHVIAKADGEKWEKAGERFQQTAAGAA
jgi:hypothetical protein